MEVIAAPTNALVVVQVLKGLVLRCGQSVSLSTSERQLVMALALQPYPLPSEGLCELLYPERDYDRVRTLLKVYVCRLRHRIGPDFIVRDSRGYALGPDTRVDANEFGPLIDEVLRRRANLTVSDRQRIERIARLLRAECPSYLLVHEWYATAVRRLSRQGRDIIMTLAEDAYRDGDLSETVRLTRELIYDDACDEAARELAIRAHLRAGDKGAAFQEFRFYRKALAEELQTTPSRELAALVSAAGV